MGLNRSLALCVQFIVILTFSTLFAFWFGLPLIKEHKGIDVSLCKMIVSYFILIKIERQIEDVLPLLFIIEVGNFFIIMESAKLAQNPGKCSSELIFHFLYNNKMID
ncbi:hypothetical protein RIF29_07133 [Crotalaria pallida]|uniref:Uncharacterized protein n=1 Tax=Crotalaria pallida TaxID=3830 RepID=A0AAN9J3V0_CROPI